MQTKRMLPWAAWLLAAVVFARLASLAFYPLTDATEARYANIARVMLETGDWITPQTTPGAVFWGKPPLFAWASAASMGLVSVGELGARLPSLVFATMTLLIVYGWAFGVAARAGRERPGESGVAAALVSATCFGFFVVSGAVMTDPSLVFATTWALASFWMATIAADSRWRWRFGFFAALGVGMLAKGPVSVVLVAVPIAFWCLLYRRWADLRSLPWLRGTALAAVIALPWYIVAEMKTPGFLKYFVLGENLQRFLVPGWQGDLYGFAHTAPRGFVWLYFATATLPWSLIAVPAAWTALVRGRKKTPREPAIWFLWLAMLSPLVFFSFSAHVIWTYALPSIPPLAVLMSIRLTEPRARSTAIRHAFVGASVMSILFAGSLVALSVRLIDRHSTREIYREWEAARATVPGPLIFEGRQVIPSLLFYSDGAARADPKEEDETVTHYDVYRAEQVDRFAGQPAECVKARVIIGRVRDYVLVREMGLPQYCDID